MDSKFNFKPESVLFPRSSEHDSDGGGPSRRKFLKRTGGATAAAFLTWQAASQSARADVIDETVSGVEDEDEERNWKIKADEVSFAQFSTGGKKYHPHGFDHDLNPATNTVPVRKILNLTVEAEATEWSGSATSAMTVLVEESAEYESDPVGNPGVWTEMSEAQFLAYRGGPGDFHSTAASILKVIDTETGEITSTTKTPESYNETESDINITLSWEGDGLIIAFSSSDVIEESHTVEPTFRIKSFSKEVE